MNRWELGWRDIPVSQYRRRRPMWSSVYSFFVPISVAPYSIIPSIINWRFCGVMSNYHFRPGEKGKSIDELLVLRCIYCSKHVSSICWPRSWRRCRFVFRAFFPPIYTMLILIFCLFHLFWLLRETKRETVACYFIFFSFRQHIFHHLTLHQYSGLLSKYLLKASFHFLAFSFCS